MTSSIFRLIVLDLTACVCGLTPTFDEEVSFSDAVFLGEVIAKRPDKWPPPGESELDGEGFAYTFRVKKLWKGDHNSTIEVITGTGGGDCGFAFDAGESYLVFAVNYDDKLYTSYCSRTDSVADADDIIDRLGSPIFDLEDRTYQKWILAVVGLLIVLLALWFFKIRTNSVLK